MSHRPVSPDGKWEWDGQQWQPRQQAAVPKPATGAGKAGRTQLIAGAVVGGIVVLGLIWGVIAAATQPPSTQQASTSSTQNTPAVAVKATPVPTPWPTPAPTPRPVSCSQPCAVANGVTVTVTDVHYGVDSGNEFEHPEAGNVYVTMNVDMHNDNSDEAHLNPLNFVLQDAKGVKHSIAFSTVCSPWQAINLTKGASSGPKCLVFEAAANAPSPLTLVWTPRWLFGPDYNIKLS